jgi:hypothetical protein
LYLGRDRTDSNWLLMKKGESKPLFSFPVADKLEPFFPQFSSSGNLFAWGMAKGAVYVADLRAISKSLAALGLDSDWPTLTNFVR